MLTDKTGKTDVPAGEVNVHHPSPPPPPPQSQPAQSPTPPKENAGNGQNHAPNDRSCESNRISAKQFSFIMDLLKEARMTKAELNQHCVEAYGSVVDYITRHDASSLIDWLRKR
jgi:hypothetical protein